MIAPNDQPRGVEELSEAQLRALVSLLTDENPKVAAQTRRAICGYGASVIPHLRSAADHTDARLRVRARLALEKIRVALLVQEMQEVRVQLQNSDEALERACVVLTKTRYPDLDASSIRAALDAMADDLATRIDEAKSPVEVLRTMSQFLGNELGFRGNERNYYDPENSYINQVLERRVGIPISLSLIYLFVARRVAIPLAGVGMPGHFILRYMGTEPPLFVDPFHGGRLLTDADCRRYLEERNFSYHESDFLPMSPRSILLRMIGNLQLIYRNGTDDFRLQALDALKAVLRGRSQRSAR